MISTRSSAVARSAVLLAALLLSAAALAEGEVRLKHLGNHVNGTGPDKHMMGVETVLGHYALVSSFRSLCLVDLDPLVGASSSECLDELQNLDATTTVTRGDGYAFVNVRQAGFAVVEIDETALTLSIVAERSEQDIEFGNDVYFEKMAVVGDRLYVTAHAYGIRIFDVSDPRNPTLVSSLDDGFDDAFAIDVVGTTAYVADGAGGLKVVDLSDEMAPVIVHAETPETARGTSEDVIFTNGHAYVAAGGAGVIVYDPADLDHPRVYDTPVAAKHLARAGEYLAVADIGGLQIFSFEPDGSLVPAAAESATYRYRGGSRTLRLWYGVAAWGVNRVLAAGWGATEVYELVDPLTDDQADITAERQRIRFAPEGGSTQVRVANDGSGELVISQIHSDSTAFTVQPSSASLQPGESMDLSITYLGGQSGSGIVTLESNDPDESPLPIEVFGETNFLDPGEAAVPFVRQSWTIDHDTGDRVYATFDLAAHAGQIVYFHIFSTG